MDRAMAIQVLEHASLQHLTTLGFEAQAERLVTVRSEQDLLDALGEADAHQWPVTLMGGGSNLVVSGDVSGLVIRIEISGRRLEGSRVYLGAGEGWHDSVVWSVQSCGLQGLESLALIPGTVGAAPVQNIGAYGVELADLDPVVRAYDRDTQRFVEFSSDQAAYAYRDSIFKTQRDRFVITQVSLQLSERAEAHIRYPDLKQALGGAQQAGIVELMQAVIQVRQQKLPDPAVLGNAGSFFKNPVISDAAAQELRERFPKLVAFDQENGVKLSAGWLIDQCGWKGHREGGVGVSPNHALVLVHYGHEKGQALMDLASKIQASVYQTFGVQLEPEPRVI